MKIDILSLFPEFIEAFFHQSMIKRALEGGLMEMAVTNPRDFTRAGMDKSMTRSVEVGLGC